MEVAKPETLRLIDDHCISVGNIDAVFNYGGSQQNIMLSRYKLHYPLLQYLRFHLTMCHAYLCLRHQTLQYITHREDIFYPVVYKKDLSPSFELGVDNIGYNLIIKIYHLGIDRFAVGRRSVDNGEISRSEK